MCNFNRKIFAVVIEISMEPMGAQRTRSAGKIHYTPAKYKKWLEDFAKLAPLCVTDRLELEMADPVHVGMVLHFPIPKSRRKGKGAYAPGSVHTNKPDIDNAIKAVLDGMVRAGLLPDDAQVSDISVGKRWADKGLIQVYVKKL